MGTVLLLLQCEGSTAQGCAEGIFRKVRIRKTYAHLLVGIKGDRIWTGIKNIDFWLVILNIDNAWDNDYLNLMV